MRYLIIILTLASLLVLMACSGTVNPIRPAGGPVTTSSRDDAGTDTATDRTESTGSSRDTGSDTAKDTRTDTARDGIESTDSTADNAMSKKAPRLGIVQPDTALPRSRFFPVF